MQVTVGICAFNEDKNIGRLLEDILTDQELGFDFEVLVVCSGCTDKTVDIVQSHSKQDIRVRVALEKERKGKASAVNYILSNAQGDAIIFVSADVMLQKGCLAKLVSRLQRPDVGIVCGNPIPINSPKFMVGKLVQLLWSFHSYVFAELNDAGLARHATEIFIIRKGIVKRIPSETVNDDAFIAVTAKKKRWLIKFEPKSRVLICGPATLSEYFQQRRRIMYGHYQVKKLTGDPPQHLMYLMPCYPLKAMKLGMVLIKEHSIPAVIAFLLTEFAANAAATIDVFLKKSHSKWNALPSTKQLIIEPMKNAKLP
jgi:cellulose synthase/poly-beta-1,6-N-acetylglucosamine synthase-like glycosyltransferase